MDNTLQRPFLPFYTLLKREVLRFLSVSIQTVLTPVVTASLYLLVFGVSLGEKLSVMEGFTYLQFVIPGLILMGVAQNSFANSSSSLFMARYLNYIVDFLVTPISPAQFIRAYTLASMLRGIIVGGVVWMISMLFTSVPSDAPLSALAMIIMTSFLFSQFGIIAAIYSNTFDALAMFNNFLILPLIYLGGLFYPISMLPEPWSRISLANPLYYMIDGFRAALLGRGDTPVEISLLIVCIMSSILFFWASWLIKSGHKLRS